MKKIKYSEPSLNSESLEIAEIINGAKLSDFDFSEIYINERYSNNRFNPNMLKHFENLGVSFNCKSQNLQLCFMPEMIEQNTDDYLILTHTPPINSLNFIGTYDFYHGDFYGSKIIENFPFGFIVGSENFCVSGFNNYGVAIGANCESRLSSLEKGKNEHTYDSNSVYRMDELDSFIVVVLDSLCRYSHTLLYPKAKYPLYKMSFLNHNLFLINYDLWNSKLAFSKNGKVLFDSSFSSGESLKFYRTKRYDLVYNKKELFLFDKVSEKIYSQKLNFNYDNLNFNPILKSICLEKDGVYQVYRFLGDKLFLAFDKVRFSEEVLGKYAVSWAGNLRYDYIIRNDFNSLLLKDYIHKNGHRAHYLKTWGENEADFNVGFFSDYLDLQSGNVVDFHLNDTDDADLGVSSFLKGRRDITSFTPKANLVFNSYARNYKHGVKSIVFYSLDYDNDFGKLLLYNYT